MSVTFGIKGSYNPHQELNVAIGNTSTVLRLLGIEGVNPDEPGELPADLVPKVLRNLVRVKNSRTLVQSEVLEDVREGNFIFCGRTDDQVRSYVDCLMLICTIAVRTKRSLVWG